MGKFDGALLVTDYDETLYSRISAISPEDRAAVTYFVEEGGLFSVSTGRSLENFAIQMQRESLPINAPVILANGANIYDFGRGEMLHATEIAPEILPAMTALFERFPSLGMEVYCRGEVYVHNPNRITRQHLEKAGLVGIETALAQLPLPWTKAILQQEDHGFLLEVQAYLQEELSQLTEAIFSNPFLLEVTAKGSHKGSAVLWLAAYLGVARQRVYCVGNGQNDLPMLAVAARAFAPANCAPCVKAQKGVTLLRPCGEHCIAQLVEWLDVHLTDE